MTEASESSISPRGAKPKKESRSTESQRRNGARQHQLDERCIESHSVACSVPDLMNIESHDVSLVVIVIVIDMHRGTKTWSFGQDRDVKV